MKKTILKKNKLPYSLHDMIIKNILIEESNVKFIFENGFVETKEPFKQIAGEVILEEVDYDFCSVHLLSDNGNYGKFTGQKLSINNFIKEYKQFSFEVVNELYGFNRVQYSGFLSLPDKEDFIECSMEFYYAGNLIYLTEE